VEILNRNIEQRDNKQSTTIHAICKIEFTRSRRRSRPNSVGL